MRLFVRQHCAFKIVFTPDPVVCCEHTGLFFSRVAVNADGALAMPASAKSRLAKKAVRKEEARRRAKFLATGNRTLTVVQGRDWFERYGKCDMVVTELFWKLAKLACLSQWHAKYDLSAPKVDSQNASLELLRLRSAFVDSLQPGAGPDLVSAGLNRCAVVGSSGSLLDGALGREIDGHDIVLRFNNAPTVGYDAFVGSRSDVRILNSHATAAILQRCAVITKQGLCEPTPNVSQCCPRGHLVLNSGRDPIVDCFRRACGKPTAPNVLPLLGKHTLVDVFTKRLEPLSIMSGIYGLVSALLLCSREVNLYGFSTGTASRVRSPSSRGPMGQYHYYDNCGHFDSDALNKTANIMGQDWFQGEYAGRRIRLVSPSPGAGAAAAQGPRATLPPPQPCPDRKAVAYVSSLLQRRREAWARERGAGGGLPPCCEHAIPEARGMRACVTIAEHAQCTGTLRRHCPVACEACRLCPGHGQLSSYQKMWSGLTSEQLRNPPLPDYYGTRKAKIVRAMDDVTVFSQNVKTA